MNKLIKVATISLILLFFGIDQIFAESISQDPDASVIYQLEKAGSDLSKRHPIEFFIYFKNISTAKSASKELQKDGFETTVEKSASSDEWLLQAKKRMYPTLVELKKIRKKLDNLGDYDGWITPIE